MELQRAFQEFVSTFAHEMRQLRLRAVPGGAAAARVVLAFRDARAISRRTAQRFHPRGIAQERALSLLLESGIIRQPVRGRFYLDEGELDNYVSNPFR